MSRSQGRLAVGGRPNGLLLEESLESVKESRHVQQRESGLEHCIEAAINEGHKVLCSALSKRSEVLLASRGARRRLLCDKRSDNLLYLLVEYPS